MTQLLHHLAEGPADAPVLLLGPSLGTSLHVWDRQLPALARQYRVVRWDLPGHGGSAPDVLRQGGTLADLGRAVLELADSLGVTRFAYAGISLGGAVGTWLAIHHAPRVASLTVLCSSAHFGPSDGWRDRAGAARSGGTGQFVEASLQRWFTPAFISADAAPSVVTALANDLRHTDPEAYARCCDLLADLDLRPGLGRITAPTLVIAGRDDPATPAAHTRELADGIRDAQLGEIPRASHLANVEQPDAVLAALRDHLGLTDSVRHSTGMAIRRAVLGDAHVDRAVAGTTVFSARFQDFITRYAWGEIWSDGTLDRRTRSCITLTALVARGHHAELAMHVRAALTNGLTPEEIADVFLQAAVYCGVPAANAAFAVAQQVLGEIDRADQ